MTTVRVLLVDSSDDFLEGLAAWLELEPNVVMVGRARTGLEAIEQVDRLKPDLVVMDIGMSSMNGFEATREIKALPGGPRVVLTTFHDSAAARKQARAAGADELIAKADVTNKLRALIESFARTGRGAQTRAPERFEPLESTDGVSSESQRRVSRPRRKEKGV